MGLKGSLRDFGISEILQLIGLQRRGGELKVKTGSEEYRLLINSGKIVKVEKSPEAAGESLQDYLTRSKSLSPEQFRTASQKARSELKPLEVALSELNLLSAAELKAITGLRNVDLINRLFLLKDGEYEFEAGPVSYHPNFAAELDTEQLLMDGYRIKDELPGILQETGSLSAVFHKSPGEFGTADRLDPLEDRIYRLVDGANDAMVIAALARVSRFDTLKVLAELKKKGRVETRLEAARPARGLSLKAAARVVYWVLIGLFALLLLNGLRTYALRMRNPWLPAQDQSWSLERTRTALEIYRLDRGGYPSRLEELVSQGRLKAKDLKFIQNSQYYTSEQGYVLSGPGPE